MGIREHRGAIEAILFSSGEPVSAERISAVIEVDVKTVHKLIAQLIDEYESRDGGVLILKLGTSYQMVSNKEYGSFVRTALDMRRNVPLSQAALEVLAIVAYNQPITKSFMEQIRGVDCSGVVSTLCEKELNWKRTTTYTVLKKLCDRGIFKTEDSTVTSLIKKDEFYAIQSEKFVEETFHGSLPAFIAAFGTRKKPTKEEIEEIKKLIDSYK